MSDRHVYRTLPPRDRTIISSRFALRDTVIIDGDESLRAVVTGFMKQAECETDVEVKWIHAGAPHVAWVEEWRLCLAEPS